VSGEFTISILAAHGDDTWTRQLSQQVEAAITSDEAVDGVDRRGKSRMNGAVAAIRIKIDGPYGRLSLNVDDYSVVILCAGGIGITPMVSLARHLSSEKRRKRTTVILLWAARENIFAPVLGETALRELAARIDLRLFITRKNESDVHIEMEVMEEGGGVVESRSGSGSSRSSSRSKGSTRSGSGSDSDAPPPPPPPPPPLSAAARQSMCVESDESDDDNDDDDATRWSKGKRSCESGGAALDITRGSRPQFDDIFSKAGQKGGRIAVLACGPSSMVASAGRAARRVGFDFHTETFFL
jgi:hypothetical protein